MKIKQTMKKGFTLVEIMLVLVIVSILLIIGINYAQQQILASKIDKTVADMQQILNGALAYYVTNGTWPCPTSTATNQVSCRINDPNVFMPTGTLTTNAWGTALTSGTPQSGYIVSDTVSTFYVIVPLPSSMTTLSAVAQTIAGKLPVSFFASTFGPVPPTQIASCTTGSPCYVVASVTIPAQNLNNVGNLTFASLYHNGACVPVPTCPVDSTGNTMTPEIMVVPASVSGVYEAPSNNGSANCNMTTQAGCVFNVYPLSSFTAYATGGSGVTPNGCSSGTAADCYSSDSFTPITTGNYWRVCLSVITQKGQVQLSTPNSSNAWGNVVGSVLAITRCAPKNESTGSDFTIWQQ